MGICRTLEQFQKTQPNKVAIQTKERSITYEELYHEVVTMQQHLLTLVGSGKQKKIGIMIGNEPEFLSLFIAVTTLGWIAIPFDSKWTESECQHVFQLTKPDVIIAGNSFNRSETISVQTLLQPTRRAETIDWNEHDKELFYMGFTSGSTGVPKGFMRNQRSWLRSFEEAEKIFQYGRNNQVVAPGPLCHSLSLFAAIHSLHIGATFFLMPKFKSSEVLTFMKENKANVFYVVPTMLQAIVNEMNEIIEHRLLILTSGAKLSERQEKKVEAFFPNSRLVEYYGASELSFVSYSTKEIRKNNRKTVGQPFPSVTVKIRNEHGDLLPNGEIGEITIQSDLLFSGYVKNESETKKVLTKHGANIGDLGYMDENGMLTIIGRKKNMIITGGLNVFPEEIEEVIKEVGEVEETVVVGIDDEYWGQKVVAYIKWKKSVNKQTLLKVKEHCKSRLSSFKCPKEYVEVEYFPHTSSGKIARKALRIHELGGRTGE